MFTPTSWLVIGLVANRCEPHPLARSDRPRAIGGPLPSRSGSLLRYREDDAPAGTWNLFITPTIAMGRQPRHPVGSVSE